MLEDNITRFIVNANAFWNISAKPVYYTDDPPNFRSCPDGHIFIGVNMLEKTIQEDSSLFTLYLYLSHEMAHQMQYIYQPEIFINRTNMGIELQADCLACFYLGIDTEIPNKNFLLAVNNLQEKSGGIGTHGSSKQRYQSCKNGFKTGRYIKDKRILINQQDIYGQNSVCR